MSDNQHDGLITALRSYEQADEEGIMVTVSRQACEEAADEILRLRRELSVARPVVSAACAVVAADTYKRPVLSREEAVKTGVVELHDAVGKWGAAQPAACDPATA